MQDKNVNTNYAKLRLHDLETLYSTEEDLANKLGSKARGSKDFSIDKLRKALSNVDAKQLRKESRRLYNTSPIYSKLINYYANIFYPRYVIIPKFMKGVRTRAKNTLKQYGDQYNKMLEIVDGLKLETTIPNLLTQLAIDGAIYIITSFHSDSNLVDIIMLPPNYAQTIGQTNYGTKVIQFAVDYFDSLGLKDEDLENFLLSFPSEIQEGYQEYVRTGKKDKWVTLNPLYSTAIQWNDAGVPALIATYESLINYRQYSDNEVEANTNKLKRIVWHKMPIYEDKLIFTIPETKAIHRNMAKVVNTSDKTRLLTTYGDLHVEQMSDDASGIDNNVLERTYRSIFNNAGLNDNIFSGESVQSLQNSLIADKSFVWKFIEEIQSFFNLVINNYSNFSPYQAEISMLPVSPYSYQDDIDSYRDNATLGIGVLDMMVASGIKQKNIQDRFDLENYLNFDQIKPLKSSYTQTDNSADGKEQKEESSTTEKSDSKEEDNKEVEETEEVQENE